MSAYQSALLLTPLVLLRIFASIIGFWPWLRTLLTLLIILPALYMACVLLGSLHTVS